MSKNFEGDVFRNATGSQFNELYLTPDLDMALKYALRYAEEEHAYLAVILKLKVPEDTVYSLRRYNEEKGEIEYTHEMDLLDKAKEGNQVIIRKGKGGKKWRAPFFRTKYLDSIIEVRSKVDSKKELKKEGEEIKINGSSERVKEYIKSREEKISQ